MIEEFYIMMVVAAMSMLGLVLLSVSVGDQLFRR